MNSRCNDNDVFTTTMPLLTICETDLDHLIIPEGISERIAYQTMLVCVFFDIHDIIQYLSVKYLFTQLSRMSGQ